MFGTIVFYRQEKGFGFIRASGQPSDVFFHCSEFGEDEKLLVRGAVVEFRLGTWRGKTVARDVRLVASKGTHDDLTAATAAQHREVRAVLGGAV